MTTPTDHTTDHVVDRIARGRQAGLVLDVLGPTLAAREAEILSSLKARFASGKLDGQQALLAIAALVELLQLRDQLQHDIRQGERAASGSPGRSG